MIQRQCAECGGELVLARRTDNQQGVGAETCPSIYWRCCICGSQFTAEQIRKYKRAHPPAIEHA